MRVTAQSVKHKLLKHRITRSDLAVISTQYQLWRDAISCHTLRSHILSRARRRTSPCPHLQGGVPTILTESPRPRPNRRVRGAHSRGVVHKRAAYGHPHIHSGGWRAVPPLSGPRSVVLAPKFRKTILGMLENYADLSFNWHQMRKLSSWLNFVVSWHLPYQPHIWTAKIWTTKIWTTKIWTVKNLNGQKFERSKIWTDNNLNGKNLSEVERPKT